MKKWERIAVAMLMGVMLVIFVSVAVWVLRRQAPDHWGSMDRWDVFLRGAICTVGFTVGALVKAQDNGGAA